MASRQRCGAAARKPAPAARRALPSRPTPEVPITRLRPPAKDRPDGASARGAPHSLWNPSKASPPFCERQQGSPPCRGGGSKGARAPWRGVRGGGVGGGGPPRRGECRGGGHPPCHEVRTRESACDGVLR